MQGDAQVVGAVEAEEGAPVAVQLRVQRGQSVQQAALVRVAEEVLALELEGDEQAGELAQDRLVHGAVGVRGEDQPHREQQRVSNAVHTDAYQKEARVDTE